MTSARLAIVLAAVVAGALSAVVVRIVRTGPSRATRPATEPGVLFLVTARRWQYLMFLIGGLVMVATGLIIFVIGLAGQGLGPEVGGPFIGVVFGLPFLALARWRNRSHLEVTADSVWVFKGTGKRVQVPLSQVTRLTVLSTNRYGGVVARAGRKKLFSANTTMLGYPQLIDYLQTQRPDLEIPLGAWPLQEYQDSDQLDSDQPEHPRHAIDGDR